MEADEEMERKEKSASAKKLSQRPPSLGEVESPPRPRKTRAGAILARGQCSRLPLPRPLPRTAGTPHPIIITRLHSRVGVLDGLYHVRYG